MHSIIQQIDKMGKYQVNTVEQLAPQVSKKNQLMQLVQVFPLMNVCCCSLSLG